jgi:hypothetical protein
MQSTSVNLKEFRRLAVRFGELKSSSPVEVLRRGLDKLAVYAYTPIARTMLKTRRFELDGASYFYFTHHYNATWRNERAVEIALALPFLLENQGRKILELGNVLSYYWPHECDRDVVDKYEVAENVINSDILDYRSTSVYEAFLSISTFEHIGWDELPRKPEKIEAAFASICELVSDSAKCLSTVPLGYNSHLDGMISAEMLPFARNCYLHRVSEDNEWRQCEKEEALKHKYASRFPGANAILVGRGFRSQRC